MSQLPVPGHLAPQEAVLAPAIQGIKITGLTCVYFCLGLAA